MNTPKTLHVRSRVGELLVLFDKLIPLVNDGDEAEEMVREGKDIAFDLCRSAELGHYVVDERHNRKLRQLCELIDGYACEGDWCDVPSAMWQAMDMLTAAENLSVWQTTVLMFFMATVQRQCGHPGGMGRYASAPWSLESHAQRIRDRSPEAALGVVYAQAARDKSAEDAQWERTGGGASEWPETGDCEEDAEVNG